MPSLGGTNDNLISQRPWLEVPKNIGSAYDASTQPIQGILDPYQRGITDTVLTRNATNDLLTAYGQGQRQRIDQEFSTRAANAAGGLAARGFGGSSLQLTEALGVERERQLARGALEDSIIGQRLGNSLNYAQLIAQQTSQSGDAQTSLMRTLLGLSQSSRAPNSSGGGGGGGFGSSVGDGTNDVEDAYNKLPPLTNPFLPGGGVSGGGTRSGGGGGGGGSSGGGGAGQTITNPFLPPGGGGNVTEGSATGKQFPPIPPTGPIPLIPDQGPRLTPEEYAENQKRLAQAKAEGRTTIFGGNYVGDVNPGDPGQV